MFQYGKKGPVQAELCLYGIKELATTTDLISNLGWTSLIISEEW